MKNPSPGHVCGFCGGALADAEMMFRSPIGGAPAEICGTCVEGFHAVLVLHRRAPDLAAQQVMLNNLIVAKARRA